jgi:hypothetical protein
MMGADVNVFARANRLDSVVVSRMDDVDIREGDGDSHRLRPRTTRRHGSSGALTTQSELMPELIRAHGPTASSNVCLFALRKQALFLGGERNHGGILKRDRLF